MRIVIYAGGYATSGICTTTAYYTVYKKVHEILSSLVGTCGQHRRATPCRYCEGVIRNAHRSNSQHIPDVRTYPQHSSDANNIRDTRAST